MTGPARPVRRVGDRALLVDCADGGEARALRRALVDDPPHDVLDVVAGARTVLVRTGHVPSAVLVADLAHRPVTDTSPEVADEVVLDVVYDGPDLAEVAAHLGTDADGVVRWHTGSTWTAAFLGFAPGFAYLEPDGGPRAVPRRAEPRTTVPAGSVALAGPWSAVYPRRTPGGWQLVGRTDHPLWVPDREQPAVLTAGTRVRFRAVRDSVAVPGPRRGPGEGSRSGPVGSGAPGPDGTDDAAVVLEVLDPGPLTLVEDLGRPGRQSVGVPISGALDRASAVRANRLVGNRRGAAVLESFGGLALRATADAVLALTGARCEVRVAPGTTPDDGTAAPAVATTRVPWARPFLVPAGATVRVAAPSAGARVYVAVRGGVAAPRDVGSRSTDLLSGLGPPPLRRGDRLVAGRDAVEAVAVPLAADDDGDADRGSGPPDDAPVVVHAVAGPRDDWLEADGAAFWATTWEVTAESNRVGLRLAGGTVPRASTDELGSEPMVPGAVQVPPSGRPVVLLADHPATGGYPVVAVVADDDLDRLGRLRPGDRVRFARVTP